MKRTLQFLSLLLVAAAFVSCSSSSSDKELVDKTALTGEYAGKRTISKLGQEIHVDDNHLAEIMRDPSSEGRKLLIALKSPANPSADNMLLTAYGFTDHEAEYRFSLDKIREGFRSANEIPDYIKELVGSTLSPTSATLQLECKKGARYDVNSKILTFTYEGDLVVFEGTNSLRMSVSYSYALLKK